jgi:acetyltransferase-like isoleucine patch superfamily enzyme
VRGVIPARCVVAGVPAKIIRRWVEGQGWIDEKGSITPEVSPDV